MARHFPAPFNWARQERRALPARESVTRVRSAQLLDRSQMPVEAIPVEDRLAVRDLLRARGPDPVGLVIPAAMAAEDRRAARDLPRDRELDRVEPVIRAAMAVGMPAAVTAQVMMVQAPAMEMVISPIPETVEGT